MPKTYRIVLVAAPFVYYELRKSEFHFLWLLLFLQLRGGFAVQCRALLDEIEKTLKHIRGQYKRHTLDYCQVMAALKDLYRKMRFYQVALDAGHAVDAMGNIHRRR